MRKSIWDPIGGGNKWHLSRDTEWRQRTGAQRKVETKHNDLEVITLCGIWSWGECAVWNSEALKLEPKKNESMAAPTPKEEQCLKRRWQLC